MATWYIFGWIISGLISAWLLFEADPSMYTLGDAFGALIFGLSSGPFFVSYVTMMAIWILCIKPILEIKIKK